MLKDFLKNTLQSHGIFVSRGVLRGYSAFLDISNYLGDKSLKMVLDVGANEGKISRNILDTFPKAFVHCFEPNPSTFKDLKNNLSDYEGRFATHSIGLSDKHGEGRLFLTESNKTSTFKASGNQEQLLGFHDVEIGTIDWFFEKEGLAKIDFLKIDTEGMDLAVLRGARNVLSSRSIGIIEAEVTFSPANDTHVTFFDVYELLKENFFIFGFYEQMPEYFSKKYLRRVNVVFVDGQYQFD